MGSMGIPYEYVIKQKRTATVLLSRVALIVSYVLWTALLIAVAII